MAPRHSNRYLAQYSSIRSSISAYSSPRSHRSSQGKRGAPYWRRPSHRPSCRRSGGLRSVGYWLALRERMLLKWFKLKSNAHRFIRTIKFIIQQLPRIGGRKRARKGKMDLAGSCEAVGLMASMIYGEIANFRKLAYSRCRIDCNYGSSRPTVFFLFIYKVYIMIVTVIYHHGLFFLSFDLLSDYSNRDERPLGNNSGTFC